MKTISRQSVIGNGSLNKNRKNRVASRSAFTLVEVIIGLGLVMFAIVPIMSLLPVALNTSADSNRTIYTANIIQQLSNEANLTDFSSLKNLATNGRYFDDQGFETTGSNSVNWTYKAVVTLTASNSAWTEWSSTAYPTQTSSYSSNMRRMQVDIYARSRPNDAHVTNIILSNQGL